MPDFPACAIRKQQKGEWYKVKLGMKNKPLLFFLLLTSCFLLPTSTFAANIQVTTNADSGAGSLREAITIANSNGEADTITFTISSQTITPLTQLPALSEGFATTIDGTGAKIYLENFIKR